jgi:hypothetical protein
LGED